LSNSARGKQSNMLRKVLWSGLYAGLSGATALASRRLAAAVWRLSTGDSPPAKR
jgi:hypothetical protein